MHPGTRITRVTGNASLANRTIFTGSARVLGVKVAFAQQAATDLVTLQDNDGNTLMSIAVGGLSSEKFDVPWLAENGLIAVSASSAPATSITIIHGQDGA